MKKFITEIFGRLFSKDSPSFFVIIQKISAILAFFSGLPILLQQLQSQTGFVVPSFMTDFANKAFFFSGIAMFIIAKLPVSDPTAKKVKKDGTSKEVLPYTNRERKK